MVVPDELDRAASAAGRSAVVVGRLTATVLGAGGLCSDTGAASLDHALTVLLDAWRDALHVVEQDLDLLHAYLRDAAVGYRAVEMSAVRPGAPR